MMAKHFSWNM